VVGQAFATSRVEVLALVAVVSWGTNTLAQFVVKVACESLWVVVRDVRADAWVSTLAIAGSIVESEHVAFGITWAILWQAKAATMLAVPVLLFVAWVRIWRAAGALAVQLIPVVATWALFWLAFAAAVLWLYWIDSPVLVHWAHVDIADASAELSRPMETFITLLGFADARAGAVIEHFAVWASSCWGVALALAVLVVEVVEAVWVEVSVSRAVLMETLAFTGREVPVLAFRAVDWSALALAVDIVPIKIVWTDLWAALTLAKHVVPNVKVWAGIIFGLRAFAFARCDIELEAISTVDVWIASAAALVGAPVEASLAWLAIDCWVLAHAGTFLSVEVESCWTDLRRAFACARVGVEVKKVALTILMDAIARTIVPEELLSLRASLRQASALAPLLIEVRQGGVDLSTVVTRYALASTIFEIPSLAFFASLWLALAVTGVAVPNVDVVRVWCAISVVKADALALFKVPNEVFGAILGLTDASACGRVEDLILTRAVAREESARAVFFFVHRITVYELIGCAVRHDLTRREAAHRARHSVLRHGLDFGEGLMSCCHLMSVVLSSQAGGRQDSGSEQGLDFLLSHELKLSLILLFKKIHSLNTKKASS
jgi:hypothetical protein